MKTKGKIEAKTLFAKYVRDINFQKESTKYFCKDKNEISCQMFATTDCAPLKEGRKTFWPNSV